MKIAYLIAAHTDPDQLRRLVLSLNTDKNAFYIHIDKKRNQVIFENVLKDLNNVKFIEKRIDDCWGGYSHMLTLDHLLEVALQEKHDRLVYISGLDYPVWSNERMEQWYQENPKKEILCAFNLNKNNNKIALEKINHLAWWDVRIKNEKNFNKFRRKLNDFLALIPHPVSFKVEGKEWDIFWGSDWWSLTYDAAKYCYEIFHRYKIINKYFKWCFCPSELWIQTILANSPIYKNRIDYTNDFRLEAVTPLQHIDYRGPMKVWTKEDYEEIIASGKMFIRKTTTEKSLELQNLLDIERKGSF